MTCWKCGAAVQGDVCPVCGCVLSSRRAPAGEAGAALRYAYDKFGPERILTDHDTLRRCLSDLLPDEKKLRQQLAATLRTDLTDRLYAMLRQGTDPDSRVFAMCVQNLQQACSLTELQAVTVLTAIWEMIGLPTPAVPQPVQPPFQPPPPQPPAPAAPPPPTSQTWQPPQQPVPPPPIPQQPPQPQKPTRSSAPEICTLKGVLVQDATHGVGNRGLSRGNSKRYSEMVVSPQGVGFHLYRERKQQDPDPQPWLFLPATDILKVSEHFFLGTYEFTIVLKNGMRYRVVPPIKRDPVVTAISHIRHIVNQQ